MPRMRGEQQPGVEHEPVRTALDAAIGLGLFGRRLML